MRVIINPGTHGEDNRQLSAVMYDTLARGHQLSNATIADLIEILVEKGVLTLADCQALGAPHMEMAP